MAYYRSQHTSRVNIRHVIGTPIITLGLPLVFAKPKLGLPMYLGGRELEHFKVEGTRRQYSTGFSRCRLPHG
jgi:hypothetical protein